MKTFKVIWNAGTASEMVNAKSAKDAVLRLSKKFGLDAYTVIESWLNDCDYEVMFENGNRKCFKLVPKGSWIASNIQWDTDGVKGIHLPKEMYLQTTADGLEDDLYPNEDMVTDYLSDTCGYCVFGYEIKCV